MDALCLFVKFIIVVSVVSGQKSCLTPKNAQGECKVIGQCPVLFSILKQRPINSQNADLLKRSACGFEDNLPKVCCPLEGGFTTTSRPTVFEKAVPASSPLLPSRDICGVDNQNRILGGKIAGIQDFPWMALIEYERDTGGHGFYCGGVLINKRYILTAAHCLKGKALPSSWKLVSVRLGEYNTETEEDCEVHRNTSICSPPPLNIPVEEKIAHEDYEVSDSNQYHDIGLLRLAKEVDYSVYVKPICLPNTAFDQAKSYTGKNLTVVGWGKNENGSESAVKLMLDVPVVSDKECNRTYYTLSDISLRGAQLCAGGERGKDSCAGDSGGPLMGFYPDEQNEFSWYSIGIVSFGPVSCGTRDWPGVYTKVANYVDWIVSKLKPS